MAGLAQFLVGHELNGRYRLETVLGEGGFGVVFHAADLQRGRDVAVKVLDPPRGMTPVQVERLRHRFVNEAEIAARLPLHPNLVRVLDFGSTERLDFLVMELLRGESLRERLARPEPVSLRSALHLLRDAARGVAVGHENGLVHRDLKPANLFLEGDGQSEPHVRILDFGIAKLLDDDEDEETRTHLTLPGEWFGSEFYSPPEHLRRQAVTRASDVYSLGVVAFELLTRTRLFSKDDMVRRKQGLAIPIPSIAARNAAVPREVEVIVRRALADDPTLRYEDAGALATELHRVLSRLRRSADLPVAATAEEEATVLAVAGSERAGDADATALAGGSTLLADETEPRPRTTGGWLGLRRRARDAQPVEADPAGLDGELRRARGRMMRKRSVQLAAVMVLGTAGVLGGYGIAAMRAAEDPAASAPPRTLTAVEENAEGLTHFRRGRYGEAAEAFARAMRKAPGQAEYANNHAYALLRAGRTQEAVAALGDVVAQHPEREVAYSNLAEAQLASGDTAGAVASMQSLLAMEPSAARRREAEAFLNRLDAHRSDLDEWEDVQDAPVVSVPELTAPGAWDQWVEDAVAPATDTTWAPDGGMTVSERYGSEATGVERRRRRTRDGDWRDTLVIRGARDSLRFEAPRWSRP